MRPQKMSSRRLQDVLIKTNIFVLAIRLQYVLRKRFEDIFKTCSRRLQDVLQNRLRDIFKMFCKDVFKALSRRVINLNYSWSYNFKTSSRCIRNVFEKNCSDGYLQEVFLGDTSEKFMVSVQNFKER